MVTLAGRSDDRGCVTHGDLDLDSLTYRGLQLTQVRGPLWANEEVAYLGRWASQQTKLPPRHLTANAYGGTLTGDGRIRHAGVPQFSLDVSLADADLKRFAAEFLSGQHDLKGRIFGKLSLGGSGRNAASVAQSLRGTGEIQLTKADIYKLPQMIALLKFLRLQQPDTTAFTQSQMKFQVNGGNVVFDQLDLRGDAISLFGKGEIGFNRRVNLTFQYAARPRRPAVAHRALGRTRGECPGHGVARQRIS